MFIQDKFNNIGRGCSVNGPKREGRVWTIRTAVTGDRYLVRHVKTGEYRTVRHSDLSNLY